MSVPSNMRLINLFSHVSKNDSENELFLEICKRHDKYTPESLVEELRQDASNTIGRFFTGSVDYDEVVKRVASKIDVDDKDISDDETKNELLIVRKVLQDYIKKNPEAEEKLKDVVKDIGVEYKDFLSLIMKGSGAAFLMMAESVGPYIIWRTVALIMLRFVGVQTACTVARIAALAVPFLNIAMAAWLIIDISGPAYRKIVPSVLNIALLRLQVSADTQSRK